VIVAEVAVLEEPLRRIVSLHGQPPFSLSRRARLFRTRSHRNRQPKDGVSPMCLGVNDF